MEKDNKIIVSVIIVSYNSDSTLLEALKSLRSSEHSLEIILVDNNSSDNSIATAKKIFPEVIVIENKINKGFASACNQGANTACGEYLLFHNPDLTIDKDCITNLLKVYSLNKNIAVLGGRMRFPNGNFQATCRKFPNFSNILFSRGAVFSYFKKNKNLYTMPDYDQTVEVDAIAGTLLMIKKELFLSSGGFDDRFFMYMEDTDLCCRLKKQGLHNYFVPSAGGVHLWGKGSKTGKTKRLFYHHISIWKYFKKHFPRSLYLIILPVMLFINFIIKLLTPSRR